MPLEMVARRAPIQDLPVTAKFAVAGAIVGFAAVVAAGVTSALHSYGVSALVPLISGVGGLVLIGGCMAYLLHAKPKTRYV
jgi:predicted phage tail protein